MHHHKAPTVCIKVGVVKPVLDIAKQTQEGEKKRGNPSIAGYLVSLPAHTLLDLRRRKREKKVWQKVRISHLSPQLRIRNARQYTCIFCIL